MATPRKEGREYKHQDDLLNALEKAGLEPGKDFKFKTRFHRASGKILSISLSPTTTKAGKFFADEAKIKDVYPSEAKSFGPSNRSNGMIVRYEEITPRTKSKGKGKKPSIRKRSIRKMVKRLPYGSGKKPHVRGFNGFLERLSPAERMECLKTVVDISSTDNTDLKRFLNGHIIIRKPTDKEALWVEPMLATMRKQGLIVSKVNLLKGKH